MYIDLVTERLRLRPINLDDAEFIIDLLNSKGWLEFIGNRNVLTENEAKKYIQKVLDNENYFYSVFELKTSQKPMGIITFLKKEGEKFPDIGFALLPQFEGNGYTFEACEAYLSKVKDLNKHKQIIAITKPDNIKSINLLKRLGLQYSGDHKKGKEKLSYFSLK